MKHSIRHILSISDRFVTQMRESGDEIIGRGNYWSVNPKVSNLFHRTEYSTHRRLARCTIVLEFANANAEIRKKSPSDTTSIPRRTQAPTAPHQRPSDLSKTSRPDVGLH